MERETEREREKVKERDYERSITTGNMTCSKRIDDDMNDSYYVT